MIVFIYSGVFLFQLGHRVDKFVFIVDMEGYGFSKMLAPGNLFS